MTMKDLEFKRAHTGPPPPPNDQLRQTEISSHHTNGHSAANDTEFHTDLAAAHTDFYGHSAGNVFPVHVRVSAVMFREVLKAELTGCNSYEPIKGNEPTLYK